MGGGTFAIRFDFPEEDAPLFAGMYKDALGWAPTLRTALTYEDPEAAQRVLTNGYGETAVWGRVVQIEDSVEPERAET
jgi:hypothetical protein